MNDPKLQTVLLKLSKTQCLHVRFSQLIIQHEISGQINLESDITPLNMELISCLGKCLTTLENI